MDVYKYQCGFPVNPLEEPNHDEKEEELLKLYEVDLAKYGCPITSLEKLAVFESTLCEKNEHTYDITLEWMQRDLHRRPPELYYTHGCIPNGTDGMN